MIIDAVHLDKQLVASFMYHNNEIFTNKNFIIMLDTSDLESTWVLKDNNVQYFAFNKFITDLVNLLP